MLIEFRIKNFRSYRDEQIFSMVASTDEKLRENTFQSTSINSLSLNRSAVVYGANASGKSNLVFAFAFVRSFVQRSTEILPAETPYLQPFLFNSENRLFPAEFEISFIQEGIRFQYGFSVHEDRIHEEWLIAYPKGKPQTWFERTSPENNDKEHDWYFGPGLRGQKSRLSELTRSNSLFITVAAQFGHKQLTNVYKWLVEELNVVGSYIPTNESIRHTIDSIKLFPVLENQIKDLLQFADFGVTNFTFDEPEIRVRDEFGFLSPALKSIGAAPLRIRLQHELENEKNGDFWLDISQESQGTREFFGRIGAILVVLHRGSLLVIDELDTSLHPLLMREIIALFHNPKTNPNNAQLIFNTHDVTLLDLTLFRRDQIWFTEKDRAGATTLYSLLEYKPRNDEAILKGYMAGRYGAVPFIDLDMELFANGS